MKILESKSNKELTQLTHVSDQDLLSKTQLLVTQERELLTDILKHLQEIERRRLYCDLGCGSLFDYAVRHLKYSEAQAQRRISAMRLMKELPQIETQISNGELSLTNLAQAYTFFRNESKCENTYEKSEKLEILNQLQNQSSRQAEKILMSNSSSTNLINFDSHLNNVSDINITNTVLSKKEIQKLISVDLSEIKFIADQDLLKKLDKVKALFAHKLSNPNLNELLHFLCDQALNSKLLSAPKTKDVQKLLPIKSDKNLSHLAKHSGEVKPTRYISQKIKEQVWQKANGSCENCKSNYALEIDHQTPYAQGGSNKFENLRLLCRKCNQRAAIKKFGIRKMEKFLN